ncbi:uncharacterized protein MONBRDRAFT_37444 [Monosiga brevicollis MX1]|uniref:DNA sliding clamp PCNA n=1 Tax=Monosiga brevicollis TaxID=81824 RepID=A9V1S7_MONBE|nr:uncharacterized protein MONBRDRAFT_37444 [Monosiga brevicollis MX1]EDQ88615.1 predicted protein [Monosiga brevicollis MX1]|eukprot:XP_001746719.1 hypothetical protein [Monosiga brevicollis MX1]
MFEATFNQASILKQVLEATKDLVNDANWDCSAEGIALQAMDSSHVSLVSLSLRGDELASYRCENQISLGINMNTMTKILKCAENNDRTIIRADDDADVMVFVFESEGRDKTSKYEMKLMDIDSEHLGIPEQEYSATVQMSSKEFSRIVRDLSTIGENVEITVDKEGITFGAKGESGSGTVSLKSNPSVDEGSSNITIDLTDSVKLNFALRYLTFFTKAAPLSDNVSLSLSADVPLMVEYAIGDVGFIRYYLAPKIDDDEDTEE